MPTPFSSGRRPPRSARQGPSAPLEDNRIQLTREEAELLRKQAEIQRKAEEARRLLAELPKRIEAREKKQREMMRLKAALTATTADGISRLRDKRFEPVQKSSRRRRMTKPEERSARFQFLLLCAVLGVILVLLWRSLP